MTSFENRVKELCDEVYKKDFQQITIDLVQNAIEELLGENNTRDRVGAACYEVDILLEAMNPVYKIDVILLTNLQSSLLDWENDIEGTNRILGIPIEK